jgi:hypothetical protein
LINETAALARVDVRRPQKGNAMKKLLILAILFAPAAQAAFKCTDEKGRTHIGDTPPPACSSVVMYEVSSSGVVLRKFDPTLTGEQAKAKQDEIARRKEQDKLDAEQRRKDIALMATYGSEKDIDTSRELNLKPIDARIKSAQDRVKAVEKRQKELDEEMEFYKAGSSKAPGGKSKGPPAQLVQDVERTKAEKAALEKSIVDYQKEMVDVKERYDNDKKRWVKLKEMQREGKLDLRSPQEIEAAKKVEQAGQPVRR